MSDFLTKITRKAGADLLYKLQDSLLRRYITRIVDFISVFLKISPSGWQSLIIRVYNATIHVKEKQTRGLHLSCITFSLFPKKTVRMPSKILRPVSLAILSIHIQVDHSGFWGCYGEVSSAFLFPKHFRPQPPPPTVRNWVHRKSVLA